MLEEPYGWLDDQANNVGKDTPLAYHENADIITYTSGNSEFVTKFSPNLYTSTANTINSIGNYGAFYGIITNPQRAYEYYQINGNMYSTNNADDDVIAYVIAFHTDENGYEHTLSIVVSGGGFVIDTRQEAKDNPDGVVDNGNATPSTPDYNVFGPANTNVQGGLVYNFGKKTSKLLHTYPSNIARSFWGVITSTGGGVDFEVIRIGKTIETKLTFNPDTSPEVETKQYILNEADGTDVFYGKKQFGFAGS